MPEPNPPQFPADGHHRGESTPKYPADRSADPDSSLADLKKLQPPIKETARAELHTTSAPTFAEPIRHYSEVLEKVFTACPITMPFDRYIEIQKSVLELALRKVDPSGAPLRFGPLRTDTRSLAAAIFSESLEKRWPYDEVEQVGTHLYLLFSYGTLIDPAKYELKPEFASKYYLEPSLTWVYVFCETFSQAKLIAADQNPWSVFIKLYETGAIAPLILDARGRSRPEVAELVRATYRNLGVRPPTECISFVPEWVRARADSSHKPGMLPPSEASALVNATCPMQTAPERLESIRAQLLADSQGKPVGRGRALHFGETSIGTPGLAEAVEKAFATGQYPHPEIVEAAVQLYLQGFCGKDIPAKTYEIVRDSVMSPWGTAFTGAAANGSFAHGAVLAKLLVSRDGALRGMIKALFESGTIAHLVLWSRGMPPTYIEEFIGVVSHEARRNAGNGEAGPVSPISLMNQLLPALIFDLKTPPPPIRIGRWFWRAILPLKALIEGPKPYSNEDLFIPFCLGQKQIPRIYFDVIRSELVARKKEFDLPTISFQMLLDPRRGEQLSNSEAYGYQELLLRVLRLQSSAATNDSPRFQRRSVRAFLPWMWSKKGFTPYGGISDSTDLPEKHASLIFTRKIADAFAFHMLFRRFQRSHLLRDEDDLDKALQGLSNDNIFGKNSAHSRLKIAVYVDDLLRIACVADRVAAFETVGRNLELSDFSSPDSENTSGDKSISSPSLFWGQKAIAELQKEFPAAFRLSRETRPMFPTLRDYGGEAEIHRLATICGVTEAPAGGPSARFYETIINSVLLHPLATAELCSALTHISYKRFSPRLESRFSLKRLFTEVLFDDEVLQLQRAYIKTYVRFRWGKEAASLQLRQQRIDRLWGRFFKLLGALPTVGVHANRIEKAITKGVLPAQELKVLADFFQLMPMPCATRYLYLHYRAAELGIDYSAQFPVSERYRIPESGGYFAFSAHDLHFANKKQFLNYVKKRSTEIVLNPNDFTPANECDVELFGLACRLYRNGPPPDEATERTLQALLPHWKMKIDGKLAAFGSQDREPSPFDGLIQLGELANKCLPVPRAGRKIDEAFRNSISLMRKERAPVVRHFDAHRAAALEVVKDGPFLILTELERQYGLARDAATTSSSLLEVDQLRHQLQRLVSEISARNINLSENEAIRIFHAHAASWGHTISPSIGESEVLLQWENLLEVMADGLEAPGWLDLLGVARAPLRSLFETISDPSSLQSQLVPVLAEEDRERAPIPVHFCLTRGPTSHFIGEICNTCAKESLEKHTNKAFITFSLGDDDSSVVRTFCGGCIVILTKTADGEPAVVIRGFNPESRLERKTSAPRLFDATLKFVTESICRPLGITQVLAPYELVSGVSFSNRARAHLAFRERYRGDNQFVPLSDDHATTYNNIDMSARCIRVWRLGAERLES